MKCWIYTLLLPLVIWYIVSYGEKLLKGQLMMSDLLVIACPMWNFGIPSSL
jgi:Flavodoxin-like fold